MTTDAGDSAASSGTLSDRYRLGEVLGRGGMAVVYRAHDLMLDRPVAVKILRESVDDGDRDRFVGEAKLLARLAHPGVVTILDVGTSEGRPFLVMQLVDGPPLSAVLRGGPLPQPEVARTGSQVAAALAYAHELDVVHRDVKPGNVLLGPDGRVELADFGIARLIGDTVRHTRTGTVVGTADYLSPEQVQGLDTGPASDVYSLGLVLLECLTGSRPYSGAPAEVAMARLHRPPGIPDDLPAGWRSLLGEMTDSDPEQRPSAGVVAERLQALGESAETTHVLPTAPAPVSAEGSTRVMTAPPAGPPDTPAGGSASGLAGWWRAVPLRYRGAGVALALVAVLFVALALTDGGSGSGPSEAPQDTPAELREPLQDLHDAIHGEGS